MPNRLTVVIPTTGRDCLRAAAQSVLDQWDGEEVVIAAEGDVVTARAIFDEIDPGYVVDGKPAWRFADYGPHLSREWGHNLANAVIDHGMTGTHVGRCDDDDIFLPGALDAMSTAVRDDVSVSIFKTTWGPGHPAHGVTLWREKGLVSKGEIATPMIVWRRCEARYGHSYFGDYELARALLDVYPSSEWAWRDEVVCEVRPVAVEDAA